MELPYVIGHRGACGYAPENTLAAMQKACDLGVSWVEFDVMLTADSQPVIIHDDHDMNRFPAMNEFEAVYSHACDLGFKNMFVQFPAGFDIKNMEESEFLPDFNQKSPFKGNEET